MGLTFRKAVIGWGGVVLITHPLNPVEALTLEEVRNLLSGRITNWKDVGGPDKAVTVISVNEGFREGSVRFITNDLIKGAVAPGARLLSYFRSVPPTVSEIEGSIGVIRMRNLERLREQGQEKKVKVIGVKKDDSAPAVTPSRESIDEGTYSITRPYFLYMSPDAGKCAADFFKFCADRNPRPSTRTSALDHRR